MTSRKTPLWIALLASGLLAGACSETPERTEGDSAAFTFDQGSTPTVDQGTTPTPDLGTTPTADQGTTPTLDQGTTPTPDRGIVGSGELGDPCNYNEDCNENICSMNTHTGVKFCTKVCDPCATEPCPSGFGCQDAGLAFICAPNYPNAPCN